MKKIILFAAAVMFAISLILNFFYSTVFSAIGNILVFGSLTVMTSYFFLKGNKVRWPICLVLLFLAVSMLTNSATTISMRKFSKCDKIIALEQDAEDNKNEEVLKEENLEEGENEIGIEENLEEWESEISTDEIEVPIVTAAENVSETHENEGTITKVVERIVEVPKVVTSTNTVEKVVTKEVEQPAKTTEKVSNTSTTTTTAASPKVEPIEKQAETPAPPVIETTKPVQNNQPVYAYTGDPTGRNYTNNYGYNYGDPTRGSYSGDPTVPYDNYSGSAKISGPTSVHQGGTYTYTVSGTGTVSRSNLSVPANTTANINGNQVRVTFEEGYTGSYAIGYGNSSINVNVNP